MKTFGFIREIKDANGKLSHYCGYVGIVDGDVYRSYLSYNSEDEPLLDEYINVHGGITFDSCFSDNYSIIPLTEIPKNWYNYRCIGFDLNHVNDDETGISKDFAYCKEQVLSLKKQIDDMISKGFSSTGD